MNVESYPRETRLGMVVDDVPGPKYGQLRLSRFCSAEGFAHEWQFPLLCTRPT